MFTFLYRIGTAAYFTAIRLGARLGVSSAQKWVRGRHNEGAALTSIGAAAGAGNVSELAKRGRAAPPLVWVHAASLGEWEQGRPVVAALRRRHPEVRVLLTFFSPSGYDRSKDDPLADYVRYLPADHPRTARHFIRHLRPAAAVFVKYEFWFYFLRELRRADVPTYLVAASFRPTQPFFHPRAWVRNWWVDLLGFYTKIVVQTTRDRDLLLDRPGVPADRVAVGGDPRLDRVLELATTPFTDDKLAAFTAGDAPVLMAGSVWPEDVRVLQAARNAGLGDFRLILAPHQLTEAELMAWTRSFGAVRYTKTTVERIAAAPVLILDVIGILSRAYRYADVAYVGGAFRTGLHNTLEPLAYGLPTVFGPNHDKFPEAAAAIAAGGARSIDSAEELRDVLEAWKPGSPAYDRSVAAQHELAEANRGAGERTFRLLDLGLTNNPAAPGKAT